MTGTCKKCESVANPATGVASSTIPAPTNAPPAARRNTKRRFAAAAGVYCVSLVVHADCVLPPAPSKIPDGQTASAQVMITAMQTFKEYNTDVETYLRCIDFEAKQKHMTSGDQLKLHNVAVGQLTKVADKFNEQVRVFKSRGH